MTGRPKVHELATVAAVLRAARPEASLSQLIAEAADLFAAAAEHIESTDPERIAEWNRKRAIDLSTTLTPIKDPVPVAVVAAPVVEPEARMSWKKLMRQIPRSRPEHKRRVLHRWLMEAGTHDPVAVVPASGGPPVHLSMETGAKAADRLVEDIRRNGMPAAEAQCFLGCLKPSPAVGEAEPGEKRQKKSFSDPLPGPP